MATPAVTTESVTTPGARPPSRADRPRSTHRFGLLDGLRFLAAFAVLLYHFTARRTVAWEGRTPDLFPHLHPFSRYGYLGVDLFFFISGFVILMTAWGRDVPHFVASRAGRLFPAYWTAVLLTGAMLVLTNGLLKDLGPGELITNLTMLQTPFGVDHVDGVYWTLWVELRFYLLMGLLVLIGVTRHRVMAFAMVWPLVGAMAQQYDNAFISELLIAGWSPYFAAGMLLYLASRDGWSTLLALLVGFQVILAMTRAAQYTGPVTANTGGPASPIVAACGVAVCFGLVALATTTPLRRVSWTWLTTLGAITYPLYLIHEYWGWLFIHELRTSFSPTVTALLAAVAVVVMAWLVYRLVERPLGPRLRRATLEGIQGPLRSARPTSD
jgi:peptidoglycan/LPS O-acetylase OafA/YrhL